MPKIQASYYSLGVIALILSLAASLIFGRRGEVSDTGTDTFLAFLWSLLRNALH
jgi:hypothetical protein